MRLTPVLCGLALSLAAVPASAQFYVAGQAGVSIAQDSEITSPALAGVTLETEFSTGYAAGLAAGFKMPIGLRFEGEVTYRGNDIDDVTLAGISLTSAGATVDGELTSWSFMANGWYDIATGSPVTPYVGGGIGMTLVDGELSFPSLGLPTESESDTVFAFQVGGGVAYELTPRIDLTLDYRYFQAADPEFRTIEAEYASHNIMAGVRFSL